MIVEAPQSRLPMQESRGYEIDRCVHGRFEQWAEQRPEAIAVLDHYRKLTYAEFNRQANRIARFLLSHGVVAGDFVGLFLNPGLQMLAAVMGIYKAGGVYVPLDPDYPAERLSYLISDARPRVIVTDASLRGLLPAHSGTSLCLDREAEAIAACSGDNPEQPVDLQQTAYINYTSGSTGKPKGAIGYHYGLANYLVRWGRHTEVDAHDRFLIRASFAYGAFHRQFLLPLAWGASTALASREERQNPVRLMEAVKCYGVTMFDFMPTAWRSANFALGKLPCEQRRELLTNNIRLIVAHGEPLPVDVVSAWRELNKSSTVPILNVCGGTEVTCITTSYRVPNGEPLSPVPIGRPVCDARIYLLDERRRPVPVGVPGEIYYGGPNVTRGYLHQPELTAEKFIADPFSDDPDARLFRSGDLARYLPDGNLQHIERNDLQIKLRGYRVELEEIEAVLGRHDAVERAVVSVSERNPNDRLLVAYILPAGNPVYGDDLTGDLRRFAKEVLPRYMVPNKFVPLDELPLTPSGKLNRRALPEPTFERHETQADVALAGDELEATLIGIWEAVLNFRPIGIHDEFFDLGGTSILAVYMFSEIEASLGHDLPLASLLRAPTIAELAGLIRNGGVLDPDSTLIALRPGGHKPPLFLMPHGGLHAMCYQKLARQLDPDRPVYALEPKGIDGRLKGNVTVDEQAKTYLAAIGRRQAHGPYFLGGLSGGGLIAWEIAQRLQAGGEEVKLVAMFDTYTHSYLTLKPALHRFASVASWYIRQGWRMRLVTSLYKRGFKGTIAKAGHILVSGMRRGKLHAPAGRENTANRLDLENREIVKRYQERMYTERLHEAEQVRKLSRRPAGWLDAFALFLLKHSNKFFAQVYAGGYYVEGLESLPEWKKLLIHEHVHVWRAYKPAAYDGKVALFRAAQQPPGVANDPLLGWQGLATGELEVIDVAGTHTTIITSPVLASRLQECMDSA